MQRARADKLLEGFTNSRDVRSWPEADVPISPNEGVYRDWKYRILPPQQGYLDRSQAQPEGDFHGGLGRVGAKRTGERSREQSDPFCSRAQARMRVRDGP
jgi:hypothetical protein